jgi:hypothetical protein
VIAANLFAAGKGPGTYKSGPWARDVCHTAWTRTHTACSSTV